MEPGPIDQELPKSGQRGLERRTSSSSFNPGAAATATAAADLFSLVSAVGTVRASDLDSGPNARVGLTGDGGTEGATREDCAGTARAEAGAGPSVRGRAPLIAASNSSHDPNSTSAPRSRSTATSAASSGAYPVNAPEPAPVIVSVDTAVPLAVALSWPEPVAEAEEGAEARAGDEKPKEDPAPSSCARVDVGEEGEGAGGPEPERFESLAAAAGADEGDGESACANVASLSSRACSSARSSVWANTRG